ncbi:MAG TPA: universal stress protein [Candidatus Methylomirabilis sp.]|nr:universal stress protein [Candidatus Methylomirabilis sp.]
MTVHDILVPLGGSGRAATVLLHVASLASSTGARVHLLRAVERRIGGVHHLAVREAEEYVAGVADRLRAKGVAELSTSVWEGSAVRAIVEAAQRERADLIVMTTHGRGRLAHLLFGSVAESVVRATTVPVLLLRPADSRAHPPAGSHARLVSRSGAP